MLEPNCIQHIPSPRQLNRLRQLLLIAVAATTLTGCPVAADLADPDRFDLADAGPKGDGLSCNIKGVLNKSCWGIGCHGSDTPAAQLDMQSAGAESRLIDVVASHEDILDNTTANCLAGETRVNTASPEDSVVIKKINGKQSCGGKMPVAPRTLSETDKACICEWVYKMAGATPGGENYCTGMGSMPAAGGAGGTGGAPAAGGAAGMSGSAGAAGATAGTGGGGTGGGGTGGTGGGGAGGTSGGGTGGTT